MSVDRRELFEQEVLSFVEEHKLPIDPQATIRNQFEHEFPYLHVYDGKLCYKFLSQQGDKDEECFYPFFASVFYSVSDGTVNIKEYFLKPQYLQTINTKSWTNMMNCFHINQKVPYTDPTTVGAVTGTAKNDVSHILS